MDELVVTFENCRFRDNGYFGVGAMTSIIVGQSDQNRIIVQGTMFENNNMLPTRKSDEEVRNNQADFSHHEFLKGRTCG